MSNDPSLREAQSALAAVEHGRRRVIDEIAVPGWYWYGLAVGWVALGVLADMRHPLVTTIATFVFGAAHATIAPHVIDGRGGSARLRVRADVVTRRLPALIICSLVVLGAVTVFGSLALSADGAHHPVTIASIGVAITLVLGGPQLLAAVRRRAQRAVALPALPTTG